MVSFFFNFKSAQCQGWYEWFFFADFLDSNFSTRTVYHLNESSFRLATSKFPIKYWCVAAIHLNFSPTLNQWSWKIIVENYLNLKSEKKLKAFCRVKLTKIVKKIYEHIILSKCMKGIRWDLKINWKFTYFVKPTSSVFTETLNFGKLTFFLACWSRYLIFLEIVGEALRAPVGCFS